MGAFLHFEQSAYVLHGQHILCDGNKKQIRNLFRIVLFSDRTLDISLLDIIAHHGGGDLLAAQGFQAVVHIPYHLVQIQSHIRQLLIAGHAEFIDRNAHITPFLSLLIIIRQISPSVNKI